MIQAGRRGLTVVNVPIQTNPKTRESRLFKSVPDYLRKAGPVMLRGYAMYRPTQLFLSIAAVLLITGVGLALRFFIAYLTEDGYAGHLQSLTVGTSAVLLAFIVSLVAVLAELLATNRRLLEELRLRVRRLDAEVGRLRGEDAPREGILSTGAAPWRR